MKQHHFIKIYIACDYRGLLKSISIVTFNTLKFVGDNFVSSAGIDCCSANTKAESFEILYLGILNGYEKSVQ